MRRRSFILLAVAILLTGALIRLAAYDFFNIDSDDMYGLVMAQNPPAEIIAGLLELRFDVHPPLYFVALHEWVGLVGNSLLALRASNLLLDLLTAATLIRLTVRLFGQRAGLMAGLLWTVAPLLIFAGYLTRMYVLMTTFTTLGVWCAV